MSHTSFFPEGGGDKTGSWGRRAPFFIGDFFGFFALLEAPLSQRLFLRLKPHTFKHDVFTRNHIERALSTFFLERGLSPKAYSHVSMSQRPNQHFSLLRRGGNGRTSLSLFSASTEVRKPDAVIPKQRRKRRKRRRRRRERAYFLLTTSFFLRAC